MKTVRIGRNIKNFVYLIILPGIAAMLFMPQIGYAQGYGKVYYSLSVRASRGGSVSGGGEYEEGTSASVSAYAYSQYGWRFNYWSGNVDDPYSKSTFITLYDNESITAYFSLYSELTIAVVGKGSVSGGGGKYESGDVVSVEAYPDYGWYFVEWGGDAGGTNNTLLVTMESDKNIIAYFKPRETPEVITGPYIILTNVRQSDPYYEAVHILREHRDATVLDFDPADVWGIKDALQQYDARYVTIVLRPIDIDVNLVRKFLVMSTELDDDPFSDFSYGFITGATAQDALDFVNRIIQAESEDIHNIPLDITGVSVGNISQVFTNLGGHFLNPSNFSVISLQWGDPHVIDFFFDNAHYMKDRKLLEIAGHGDPHMLGLSEGTGEVWDYDPVLVENPPVQRVGLTSDHIRALDLYPAVLLNCACYSGILKNVCVDTNLKNTFGDTGGIIRFYEMSDDFSFALSILKTGITGYFAPLSSAAGPDSIEAEYNIFLYNEPLGDIHKRTVDGVIMGFLGNRPSFETFSDGDPIPEYETLPSGTYDPSDFSPEQSGMLAGKASRVYYGDPLFHPFAYDKDEELELVTTNITTISPNNLQMDLLFNKPGRYRPVWDKFHTNTGIRVYTSVEVPDEFYSADVQLLSASRAYSHFIYAYERFDGKAILHLEIDIDDEFYENLSNILTFEASVSIKAINQSIQLGDVTENGEVSSYDASLTAQYAIGLIDFTAEQIQRADVTGNGQVSSYDASLIAQYAIGLIDSF